MSSTTLTRGNSRETFYISSIFNTSPVPPSGSIVQTFSVPGLQTTDLISVIGVTGSQGAGVVIVEADCFTANVISVRFGNYTQMPAIPTLGAYILEITRIEGPLPTNAV